MESSQATVAVPLGPAFQPGVIANRIYRRGVDACGAGVPIRIALERAPEITSVFNTLVYPPGHPNAGQNLAYIERLVKFLLWQRGGWRVRIGGAPEIAASIADIYCPTGARAFDAEFMGNVFNHPFTVESCSVEDLPMSKETTAPVGRHLKGCRIGFDAGASDWKVAAVVNGESIFSTEVPWDPRNNSDWRYHYSQIRQAIELASSKMPRLDAIGVSSAGIYINDQVMAASLFRGVPKSDFEAHIRPIYTNLGHEFGVPLTVANDGDVTALAGSMSLGVTRVLGIAMGSSEAAGYIDEHGNITGWLNELAFAPIDYCQDAPVDEWSGDRGVGASYFSQQAVIRLAPSAGIQLTEGGMPGDKLAEVQALLKAGDERAVKIMETIGVFLGYGVAHYADFYDIGHVLVLGRVTSGDGGQIILDGAKDIISREFPELSSISINLPDEKNRRVGQAVAAASLPVAEG